MEEKQMNVLTAKNIRILITKVNELKIQQENIVSLQFNDGQYLLIYYSRLASILHCLFLFLHIYVTIQLVI